jgi:SAM-dependent methyltransferase
MDYKPHDEDSLALDPSSPFFWDHLARYWWVRDFAEGVRALDVGCGKGYGSYLLAQVASEVVGIDLNQESLVEAKREFARPNLQFLEQNVIGLSLNQAPFQVITAFEVIEHIPAKTTGEFLRGIRACLAKGGSFFLSTPNHDVVTKSKMPVPEFHINNFRPTELRATLLQHFSEVTIMGQYRKRSVWNEAIFAFDFFNLRHQLLAATRAELRPPIQRQAKQLSELRSYLEMRPEELVNYRFSRWHYRQAGLTVAICRA